MMKTVLILAQVAVLALFAMPARAEQEREVLKNSAENCSGRVSENCILKDVASDQKQIWSAPLHRRNYRLGFVLPFAAGTAALLATDKQAAGEISEHSPGALFNAGTDISHIGSAAAIIGFTGAFYGIGRLTHHDRMRETGLLAGEALADSAIVAGILKVVTQRERPATPGGIRIDNGRGRFWSGGTDFPSGHAISLWALASVFAARYPDKPAVKYVAYGLACLGSMARISSRQHFPSDVLVGGVLGYIIGHYVVRRHR